MTLPTGKQRSAGFTLLEMLVAVVILALVVASLSGAFHGALSAYREGEDRGALIAAGRGACYLLGDDLRRQIAVADARCQFTGSELCFVAAPAVGAESPQLVSWSLSGKALRRTVSPWQHTAGQQPAPPSTLADGLQGGRFEYRLDGRWRDSVPRDSGRLPQAVRLRFELMQEDENATFSAAWSCVRGRSAKAAPAAGDEGSPAGEGR